YWKDHALDDLIGRNPAAGNAEPSRGVENDPLDLRVGKRRPRPRFVTEITLARLLTEMPGFAQRVFDDRMFAARLANEPAAIKHTQIHHRKRPHRQSESDQRRLDILWQCSLEQQPFRLNRAARQHTVPDKAVADPDNSRNLAEPPSERQRGGDGIRRALFAAD